MTNIPHNLIACLEAPRQVHIYPSPFSVSLCPCGAFFIAHPAEWPRWASDEFLVVCGRWPKVCIIFSSTCSVEVLPRFIGIYFNPFCLLPGAGLNDGQWHSVSLSARGNHLSVMVDGEAASMAHSLRGQIESGDTYYLGGKWKELGCIGGQTIFTFYAPAF